MPTVVDELVVSFGLDPSKFNEGQKSAMQNLRNLQEQSIKSGKEVEASSAKTIKYFESVKRGALMVGAAVFGGTEAKKIIDGITGMDASTGRLAKTVNMSTEELSAWQGAIKRVGGTSESATATIQGLSGALNQFALTGQGPFLGVMGMLKIDPYDKNRKFKETGEILLEIADSVQKLNASDPALAAATLAMIPGMNQDSINLMINGRKRTEELLDASRRAGTTTRESAKAAREYQEATADLDQSTQSLSRSLVTLLAPALSTVASSLAKLFQSWNTERGSAAEKGMEAGNRKGMNSLLGDPKDFMRHILKMLYYNTPDEEIERRLDKVYPGSMQDRERADAGAAAQAAQAEKKARPPTADREARLRQIARDEGIDPDTFVHVAKTEGLGGKYVGDRGSSFGDFQLHYGGLASGGMAGPGLGEEFTKATGLDAKDPSTWEAQARFSAKWAKKNGWGAWHGYTGPAFQGIPRGGAGALPPGGDRQGNTSTSSQNITVGSVTINAPNAKNADDIAAQIPEAIKRQNFAAAANYGQV